MIYDFTTAEMLRMANVKRWGIVEMSRPQSVTEHTGNVSLLALGMIEGYNKESQTRDVAPLSSMQQLSLLQACLVHDMPEIYSGDIPTPFKAATNKNVYSQWERERFPKVQELMNSLDPIVARIKGLCDIIEALLYLRKWCIDARKIMIQQDLHKSFKNALLFDNNKDLTRTQVLVLRDVAVALVNDSDNHGGMN